MVDDPLIGQQLANFRIERVLGRGGMGQVYYGTDIKLERPVAIKVIDTRYRANPAYAERFIREARAIATWRHDNIIQIYYADDTDGLYYFVMEYLGDNHLGRMINYHLLKGSLPSHGAVLHIGRAIASALDYAHTKGVIHRDVKPANVMVDDERIVLMDFGLAMDVSAGSQGEVFGTSHYIAPEQARRSADAVPQSDLYSLAVILYELLTGRVPFDDPSATSVALQHLTMPPPPPRSINPHLSEAVEQVLLKALAKQPAERYQTGGELIAALEAAMDLPAPAAENQPATTQPTPHHAVDSQPTPPPFDPNAELIGQYLDTYRIEELLGQGGMATIYRGMDTRLKRNVAIKVIDAPFRSDSEYAVRFNREAQAIAQLEHPYIVRLYHYGDTSGLLYMVMEYIDGLNLHQVIEANRDQSSRWTPRDMARLIREVCSALDYAHAKGVIHRDVKPSNIMIDQQGRAVLADFGLALLTEVGTQGEIFGSPHYVAPEQAISSARVVPQSDLYAIGVIMYELWTGQLPFNADDPLGTAMLHMTEPPPPPRSIRPDIAPQVEAVILKSLAKAPEDRFATGAELADALETALQLSSPIGTSQTQPPSEIAALTAAPSQPSQPIPAAHHALQSNAAAAAQIAAAAMPAIRPSAQPAPMPTVQPSAKPAPMPVIEPPPPVKIGSAPLPPMPAEVSQSSQPVAFATQTAAPQPTPAIDPRASLPSAPPPLARRRTKFQGTNWFWIVGIIVLLAVIAFAVWQFMRLKTTSTSNATTQPATDVAQPTAISAIAPWRLVLTRQEKTGLIITNQSTQALPLESLKIVRNKEQLEQWPLPNLMAANCFMIIKEGQDDDDEESSTLNPADSDCTTIIQTITVEKDEFFKEELTIFFKNRQIGTCPKDQARCIMEFSQE